MGWAAALGLGGAALVDFAGAAFFAGAAGALAAGLATGAGAAAGVLEVGMVVILVFGLKRYKQFIPF